MKVHKSVSALRDIANDIAEALKNNKVEEFKMPTQNKGESNLDYAKRITIEANEYEKNKPSENEVINEAAREKINDWFKTYCAGQSGKRSRVNAEMVEQMKNHFNEGKKSAEIAEMLNLSIPTVNNYKAKLGFTNKRETEKVEA